MGAGVEAPLERAWQAAVVWLPPRLLPAPELNGRRVRDLEPLLAAIPAGARVPVVLYVHGCRGPDDDLTQWAAALTGAGYAVFAPDAAAGDDHRAACAAETLYTRADLARFSRREAQVRYALRQVRTLRWIAADTPFVLGFDQGAVVVAGWREPDFAGYVLTGWTCTAPDVRSGLATPLDRPVLAIRWEDDPRFVDPAWNGTCEPYLAPRPGSRSVVLEGAGHSTAGAPAARAAVLRFLAAHTVR